MCIRDRCTDGTLKPQKYSAIAGVSNVGSDVNWTGHDFAQANWYAFGRLAWNHDLPSSQIADEWLKLTFNNATEKDVYKRQLQNYNSFEKPDHIVPVVFKDAKLVGDKLQIKMPAFSVLVLELK